MLFVAELAFVADAFVDDFLDVLFADAFFGDVFFSADDFSAADFLADFFAGCEGVKAVFSLEAVTRPGQTRPRRRAGGRGGRARLGAIAWVDCPTAPRDPL